MCNEVIKELRARGDVGAVLGDLENMDINSEPDKEDNHQLAPLKATIQAKEKKKTPAALLHQKRKIVAQLLFKAKVKTGETSPTVEEE